MRPPKFANPVEMDLKEALFRDDRCLWNIRVLNLRGELYTWQYDAKHCILLWTRIEKAGLFSPKLLRLILKWNQRLREYALKIFGDYKGEIIKGDKITINGANIWLSQLLEEQSKAIAGTLAEVESFRVFESIPVKTINVGYIPDISDIEYCPVSRQPFSKFKRINRYKTVFTDGVAIRTSKYVGGGVLDRFEHLIEVGLKRKPSKLDKLYKQFGSKYGESKTSMRRVCDSASKGR